MQPINFVTIIITIFIIPSLSSASTDPECIKHLGGAFAGVECYNGLANDIAADNKILTNKIAATIPNGNKNKQLLIEYDNKINELKKYCHLSRDSSTEWTREKPTINPRYHDYDVSYYECIYDLIAVQNKFLKNIFRNLSQ